MQTIVRTRGWVSRLSGVGLGIGAIVMSVNGFGPVFAGEGATPTGPAGSAGSAESAGPAGSVGSAEPAGPADGVPGSPRAASAAPGIPAGIEFVKARGGIEQYRLKSNGMEILLVPSDAAPVVTFLVVVRVGSRNEAPGSTGSAHLLEHMLFNKSTESYGRKGSTGRTIQEVLYEAGGDFSTSNMTTWCDRITMYDTLPADQLETTMKINADRLRRGKILDEERQPEMTVVRNEYERGENDPGEALSKALIATAIQASPYHWSTIGYRSDIEGVSTAKLREHYDTYFWPDNATAILVGSFDKSEALALFERHYGAFPRAPKPIPQVYTVEPPQEGERRVMVRRGGAVAQVAMAWMRPGARDPGFYPFEVLSSILGDGLSSRLHQALVETKLATTASSWNQSFTDPFLLVLNATVSEGGDPLKVEAAMRQVIGSIRESGVTAEEVARAKAHSEAQFAFAREGTYGTAMTIGEAVAARDWEWWVDYLDRIRAVTPSQIQEAARIYLGPDQITVGWFVPKKEEAVGAAGTPAQGGAGSGGSQGGARAPVVPAGAAAAGAHGLEIGAEGAAAFTVRGDRRAGPGPRPSLGTGGGLASEHGAGVNGAPDAGHRATVGAQGETAGEHLISRGVAGAEGRGVAGGSGGSVEADPAAGTGGTVPAAGQGGAVSAAGSTAKSFADRTTRRVLPNGAVLLLLPNQLSDTVSVRVRVRAGAYLDRDKPGLAEATAEMIGRGTKSRKKLEIAHRLESVGSSLAWGADTYDVVGGGACLSKNLPDLLATIVEELREPAFDGEEFEKLKNEMRSSILEEEDNTTRRAFAELSRIVYPAGNPLRSRTGTERLAALAALRPSDLREFHAARYGAGGLVIALAGKFDVAEVEALMVGLLAPMPRGKQAPVEAARVTACKPERRNVPMKDKANTDIVIGGPGNLRRADPDYYAAILANAVLGQSGLSSRLGRQVRDTEGLTYTIVSRFYSPILLDGPWGIYLSVAPANVERGIASSMGVLRKFWSEGISGPELGVEKSAAAGRFKVSLANNAGIADALAASESFGLGVSMLDEYPRKIHAVTVEEANRALRAHIHPDDLVTVMAGSVGS